MRYARVQQFTCGRVCKLDIGRTTKFLLSSPTAPKNTILIFVYIDGVLPDVYGLIE